MATPITAGLLDARVDELLTQRTMIEAQIKDRQKQLVEIGKELAVITAAQDKMGELDGGMVSVDLVLDEERTDGLEWDGLQWVPVKK